MSAFDATRTLRWVNEPIMARTVTEGSLSDHAIPTEMRRAPRVTHLGRVRVLGDCGLRGEASLQDLSTTGCRVISTGPFQVGMELQLSLVAAHEARNIVIEMAKVRWTDGDHVGLEFGAIDPLERERLRLFLKTVMWPPVSDETRG
jgi:hypothetical protein